MMSCGLTQTRGFEKLCEDVVEGQAAHAHVWVDGHLALQAVGRARVGAETVLGEVQPRGTCTVHTRATHETPLAHMHKYKM